MRVVTSLSASANQAYPHLGLLQVLEDICSINEIDGGLQRFGRRAYLDRNNGNEQKRLEIHDLEVQPHGERVRVVGKGSTWQRER